MTTLGSRGSGRLEISRKKLSEEGVEAYDAQRVNPMTFLMVLKAPRTLDVAYQLPSILSKFYWKMAGIDVAGESQIKRRVVATGLSDLGVARCTIAARFPRRKKNVFS